MPDKIIGRSEFDDGSTRHHYIPVHFIKGFVGEDGKLFRYDKERDIIEAKKYAPKQVFYEHSANSAYIGHLRHTIAERAYASLDQMFAPLLRDLRQRAWDEDAHTEAEYAALLSFAADLFFRVPANEQLYEALHDLSGLVVKDKEGAVVEETNRLVQDGKTSYKALRSVLPQNLLQTLSAQNLFRKGMVPLIAGYSYGVFVLSDNPVVFRSYPRRLSDLTSSLILPISSTRFYAYHTAPRPKSGIKMPLHYNTIAIEQAKRYVCSGNRELLSGSVQFWNELRLKGYLPGRPEVIFDHGFEASQ